jgi:hypothetical protein
VSRGPRERLEAEQDPGREVHDGLEGVEDAASSMTRALGLARAVARTLAPRVQRARLLDGGMTRRSSGRTGSPTGSACRRAEA